MRGRQRSAARRQPVNTDGHAIGLDIGATAVRAAVLALSDSGGPHPTVTAHGIGSVPLPPGAVVNGAVVEPAVVTQALKSLWDTYNFNCRRVILGTAHPQSVVRALQIPNLNAQQRAKALPFQAREIIALPLDEVILDYAQVGEPDPKTGMVSGLLIATPRRSVLAAVDAVERAGLRVARVDLSSFGALRSIADEQLEVQAVIDVGAHLTSIVIHHLGVPKLVRTVARGGQELTDLLAENLNLSLEDAERLKREVGLTTDRDAASETLQAGIRPLLAEIRGSMNYFRTGNDGARPESISLTGGGSALAGLADVLAGQLGVPVHHQTPMLHIGNRTAGGADSERGATAVSVVLAMGAAA
ncbi:MAG: type IV pilus assembly protein PilM [Nakamurella sp.]